MFRVRSILKFVEDSAVEGKRQNLQMVEAVASLETDLVNEKHWRENAEKRKSEEVGRIREEKIEEVEKLKGKKQLLANLNNRVF